MDFNLADLWERVVDTVPDAEAVVCGERRLTYAAVDARVNRLAHHLADRGDRAGRPRRALPLQLDRVPRGHARGVQDPRRAGERELPLRGRRAALPARRRRREGDRVPPRVRGEARRGAGVAPGAADVRGGRRRLAAASESLADAVDYDDALAAASPARDFGPRSPDDLYILYTGGTTGMPKGVMWRGEDIFFAAFGGGNLGGTPITTPEGVTDALDPGRRLLPACPFMHGTAHWMAFACLYAGGCVIVSPDRHFDPAHLWSLIAQERVSFLVIVGDAFGRPLDRGARRARPGARRLRAHRGALGRRDPLAVGEGGVGRPPARHVARRRLRRVGDRRAGPEHLRGRRPHRDRGALRGERRHHRARRRAPPRRAAAWSASSRRRGHIPLGYYKDPEKTAATFPVIDGVRWSVPGDHARHRGRRHHHRARPRFGVDQHRRREGVPRRGRGRCSRRTPRCSTRWWSACPTNGGGNASSRSVETRPGTTLDRDTARRARARAPRGLQGPARGARGPAGGAFPVGQTRLPLGPHHRDRRTGHRLASAA